MLAKRFGARTPLPGLYLCGSGAHPGGCVSGIPRPARGQRRARRRPRTGGDRMSASAERPISRLGEPPEAELPDDIRAIYEQNRAKIGFVPNVFRAYARRPEHFRAFMAYHDVLMRAPGGLSRVEREAIVVVVSVETAASTAPSRTAPRFGC